MGADVPVGEGSANEGEEESKNNGFHFDSFFGAWFFAGNRRSLGLDTITIRIYTSSNLPKSINGLTYSNIFLN